ncbi:phosphatidate cytidylyltransferase [Psychromarinibacter sp. C21-152]|uniref:Phosphatidate cytidylyltransferase n=1 Tax=Psychromarinibacter sediminicola TaxID=3033385 RepID=A0AAE3NQX9_9RHOB|nr:phosphatidate cytidylyltransferase [Psychromarinibacter sediminicola]MDF0600029.1 phosphatidate cytidylyltransferase [Psychromarinibacter sediminicola]
MMLAPAGAAGVVQMLALACLVLLAIGYLVVLALMFVPATRRAARETFPILLTETLIVGVVAGAFFLGGWAILALAVLLTLRTAYEAARVTLPRIGIPGLLPALLVAAGTLVLALLAAPLHPVLLASGAGGATILAIWIARHFARGRPVRIFAELAAFPVLPLVVFTAAALHGGAATLLIAFLLVETFDSYALLGGKLFGRRKAFPVLSPKKTVEGLVTGAVMLMLTAAAAGALLFGFPVGAAALVALLTGLLTVAGDLAASRLKRAAGVKDFPRILPHQGGLLDITDAWIAAGAGLTVLAALS